MLEHQTKVHVYVYFLQMHFLGGRASTFQRLSQLLGMHIKEGLFVRPPKCCESQLMGVASDSSEVDYGVC